MVSVDEICQSGGVLTAWNKKIGMFSPYSTSTVILISSCFTSIKMELNLLNCYMPYADMETFWNRLRDAGILNLTSLIIGGDLNFTLRDSGLSGELARLDSLGDFFSNIFQEANLVDIAQAPYQPTWKNMCTGSEAITIKLDRFWIVESLIRYMG